MVPAQNQKENFSAAKLLAMLKKCLEEKQFNYGTQGASIRFPIGVYY